MGAGAILLYVPYYCIGPLVKIEFLKVQENTFKQVRQVMKVIGYIFIK